jgi:hypothetical protein
MFFNQASKKDHNKTISEIYTERCPIRKNRTLCNAASLCDAAIKLKFEQNQCFDEIFFLKKKIVLLSLLF